jgi:hypothetical protein
MSRIEWALRLEEQAPITLTATFEPLSYEAQQSSAVQAGKGQQRTPGRTLRRTVAKTERVPPQGPALDRSLRALIKAAEAHGSAQYLEVTMDVRADGVVWRESALGPEVGLLYDAVSFLTWRYGRCFDTHLTISFGAMGLIDDREAAALMAPFNKEMKRWLGIDQAGPRMRRRGRLRDAVGAPHFYIYVIEHGREHGLHAHQLCSMPTKQVAAFEKHARQWWARAAGLTLDQLPLDAISMTHRPPNCLLAAYKRQVHWFRYLAKSADRSFGVIGADDLRHTVDEIFKLDPCWQTARVYTPQLYGICRELTARRQDEAGFVSKLRSGEFEEVYSGWELHAYQLRQTMRTLVL